MNPLTIALASALCLATPLAHAAGLKFVQIPADEAGPAIDAAIWSPCAAPPGQMEIRALTLPATADCPVEGDNLPLVVVSHGYGGWYLGHHDTAESLADAGFIVVAINHPYANYADMSHADGPSVFIERPVDIKRTIDFMLAASPDAAKIDPRRVGFFGFSQGGYTGLVLAGGEPAFDRLPPRCADPKATSCPPAAPAQPRLQGSQRKPLLHDPRIKAMVVADPLSIVFPTADTVKAVTIPLQLWQSEHGGGKGAEPENVATLARLLPDKPDYRVVPNAVHLSFLAPCPEMLRSLDVCKDAPGFDRAAFHASFDAEVTDFFRAHLTAAN